MPGYSLSNKDKEVLAEKYTCVYCVLLLRDAMCKQAVAISTVSPVWRNLSSKFSELK